MKYNTNISAEHAALMRSNPNKEYIIHGVNKQVLATVTAADLSADNVLSFETDTALPNSGCHPIFVPTPGAKELTFHYRKGEFIDVISEGEQEIGTD